MSSETVAANVMSSAEYNEELYRVNELMRDYRMSGDRDLAARLIAPLRIERQTLYLLRDQSLRMRSFTQDGGRLG